MKRPLNWSFSTPHQTREIDLGAAHAELLRTTGQRDNSLASVEFLQDQVAQLQDEIDELMLAYDPQIQLALAEGVAVVSEAVCDEVEGSEGNKQLNGMIDVEVRAWSQSPGLPSSADDVIDRNAILQIVLDCKAAAADEAAAAAAAKAAAKLKKPKGDGFYTVGEEIVAGTWESQGTGSTCYWARYDSISDIIDNHFGLAGGRIVIQSSDAEVQFDGCGQWEYQN